MTLGWSLTSGNLLRVTHREIEGARRNLPKAAVAIQRYRDADRGVRPRELAAPLEQPVVDFVDMQWGPLFTKQHRHGLRYRAIHKTIAEGFDIAPDNRNRLASDLNGRHRLVPNLNWRHGLVSDFKRSLHARLG